MGIRGGIPPETLAVIPPGISAGPPPGILSGIFITIPSYMSQRIFKGILPVVSPKMFFEISLETLEIQGLLRKFSGL